MMSRETSPKSTEVLILDPRLKKSIKNENNKLFDILHAINFLLINKKLKDSLINMMVVK